MAYAIAGTNYTVPEYVYMMFQMTFAIITPALIAGAFAERLKFSALLILTVLWSIFVYAPIAHWVWGGGFLGAMGVMDFAGGTVVHINAGIAGLVCALVLAQAQGAGQHQHGAQQPGLHHDRGQPVVGRLVRLQRRVGGGFANALAGRGHGQHPDRHRRGGSRLDGRSSGSTARSRPCWVWLPALSPASSP